MSYQNIYLAQKLHEAHEGQLRKSLELARLLGEGTASRPGMAERTLAGIGAALITLGQRLKEWSAPSEDLAAGCR